MKLMKLSRFPRGGRLFCAISLVLALTLAGGTAQGTPIDGSIAISANWATQDGASLDLSDVFTPYAMTGFDMTLFQPIFGPGLTMGGGGRTDDFATLPFTIITAGPLDITDPATPLAWTFTSVNGSWTTATFLNIDPAATNGYLDFLLTGTFTPAGALAGFAPTPAEMRISLNQTGATVNWTSTMNMIPEPMTMSLLAIGGLAMLRRRRRK